MPKLRKKTIYTFILVVVALYVVIAVIPAVTGKLTRTEAVTYGELKVSDDVTCYIVRDETVYLAKSAGTMSFKVKEGELVKRGAEVMLTSLSLVIAGGLGNLIDRVMTGYVIDFIDFRFWPVFNFADICVTVGCVLLCIYVVFLDKN